jgi:hypothetical protein
MRRRRIFLTEQTNRNKTRENAPQANFLYKSQLLQKHHQISAAGEIFFRKMSNYYKTTSKKRRRRFFLRIRQT